MKPGQVFASVLGIIAICIALFMVFASERPEVEIVEMYLTALSQSDCSTGFTLLSIPFQEKVESADALCDEMARRSFVPASWDVGQDISAQDTRYGRVNAQVRLQDGRDISALFRVTQPINQQPKIMGIEINE